MIWQLNLVFLILVVISALAAITVKDLASAVMILAVYSFFMALLWAEMGSVDVSFTEASVGAGVSTVFFIATIFTTRRGSKD